MKRPSQFTRSSILAFTIITILNVCAISLGGLTYGNSLRDSIINSIQTKWIQQSINLMITAHCLLTVTLIINPLNQEIEEAFNIPHEFGIKRFGIRSFMLASVVFVAESVPNFGSVLEVFGGSTVTLTSLVFPCLFYLYLSAGERKQHESNGSDQKQQQQMPAGTKQQPLTFSEMVQRTNAFTLIGCGLIIGISLGAGFVATATAIRSLVGSHFVMPCYLAPFLSPSTTQQQTTAESAISSALNCCGPFQNVSLLHDAVCNAPNLGFY